MCYKPTNILFQVDLEPDYQNISLGKKVKITIKLSNKYEKPISITENYQIDVNSNYFEIDNDNTLKDSQLYIDGVKSETIKDIKEPISLKNKKYRIEKAIILSQKVDKIIAEQIDKNGYLCNINLIRKSFSLTEDSAKKVTFSSGPTILSKSNKTIKIEPPKSKLYVKKPFLPNKGDQINIELGVELLDKTNNAEKFLPITVECWFGKDFTPIIPNVKNTNDQFVTKNTQIQVNDDYKKNTVNFILSANRAGYPGYKNKANFIFKIGSWSELKQWNLDITVLPNKFDTFVTTVIGLLGILSLYYPDQIPSLTKELNVANLSVTPGILYIAYRVMNWAKDTKKTDS